MPVMLSAKGEGGRPIRTALGQFKDEPFSITLPFLPPIRGRVFDEQGRPIARGLVGAMLHFDGEGRGKMFAYPGDQAGLSDEEGRFSFSPTNSRMLADTLTRADRANLKVVIFSDPTFQRLAYRLFDPTQQTEPMDVTLGPVRRVRVPVVRGSSGLAPQAKFYGS